jgi:hypothetical protein
MRRKCETISTNGRRMWMTPIAAAVLLLATPVLSAGQDAVSRAATSVDWTSARALKALFKDKLSVKHFLDEIANEGDTTGPEATPEVYDYRFVDLNGDGWLELVALVSGKRLPVFLDVVFQAPAPPADRLATTHRGFVLQSLSGFDVADLNSVLKDLDGDGTEELVMPQLLGDYAGTASPQATIPEVFSWKGADFAKVSGRYPEFYRDEVLPRLERKLQALESLPAAADPAARAVRRAEREKYVREIAEARRRAPQK